ncbi:MAG: hypothetical protein M3490_11045 [Chloroflexota bacterium]|nr:hypothetical protein [Chloroflexota bacterium]
MLTKTTAGKDRLLTGMSELRRQWFVLRLAMIAIYTPVALALLIVVIVRIRTGIAIADFTVDPLIVVGGAPVYTGILSTIGGLIWAGTVAICFFSWNLVRTRPQSAPQASFLLAAALVTLFLLVDDVFLGHEILYPQYLGLHEVVVYAIYGIVVAGFLVAFRTTILQTDFLLLAISLAGFGLSIGFDIIAELETLSITGMFLLEDGSKIFGLVSWAAYFMLTSAQYVQGSVRGHSRAINDDARSV